METWGEYYERLALQCEIQGIACVDAQEDEQACKLFDAAELFHDMARLRPWEVVNYE